MGLAVALTALPAPLLAAQESGIFSISVGLIVWTWVLFLLTLFILARKAFPAIQGALEDRQDRIQGAIDSAREDRDEARRLLDEHQRQLDEARREAKDILRQGRVAGDRLREEILARARSEHEELLDRARKELARDRDELVESLRKEAIDVSLAAAERLIRQELDSEANRKLVREYVQEL
jgi:F-type H+-transporting ATPase subunit b